MSEYTDAKEAKAVKKHQFSVVRAEGLQGLQDVLNGEGKVESFHQVGSGATFICVLSGVAVPEPVKEAPPVEDADEGNGNKAKKKSA